MTDQAMVSTAPHTNMASSAYDNEIMADQEGKPYDSKAQNKAHSPLDVNQRFNIAVLH